MSPPKGTTPKDEGKKANEKYAPNKDLPGQTPPEKNVQSGPLSPASTTPQPLPVSPHSKVYEMEPSPRTAPSTRNSETAFTTSVTRSLTPTGRHLRARERFPATASPPRPPKPEKNEAAKLKEAIKKLEEQLMHHKEHTKTLDKECRSLKKELNDLKNKNKSLEARVEELASNTLLIKLRTDNKALEGANKELAEERDYLVNDINILEGQIQKWDEINRDVIREWQTQYYNLTESLGEPGEMLAKLTQELIESNKLLAEERATSSESSDTE